MQERVLAAKPMISPRTETQAITPPPRPAVTPSLPWPRLFPALATALRVGNRDQRDVWKRRKYHLVLRQIEATMQRGDEWSRLAGKYREGIIIEMKVQQVELFRTAPHAFEHGHVQRIWIPHGAVEAQRARPTRLQLGRGLRVAAGE